MKSDFDIISHEFPELKEIHIYPIADVHLGSQEHNQQKFLKVVKMINDDPVGYCVLVGDLCDTALKNSKSDIYSASMTIMDQLATAAEQLRPLAETGKILGMVGGNHEKRISREVGLDASFIIAEKLGIADLYRPAMCFIQIKINTTDPSHDNRKCYYIGMTHGNGGGTTYAFLNKNQQFAQICEGCDALITGHTHKPAAITPARLRIDRRRQKITVVPILCVTASSWLDYGGYALEKMLLPAATCRPQILTANIYGMTITM